MSSEYNKLKGYFCTKCNVVVYGFELETSKNKEGKQVWIHKSCNTTNIIRVEKEKEVEKVVIQEVTNKEIVDDDIKEIDDLFV